MHGEKHCDVVLVAHGHLLRAFTKRWLGYPMEFPLSLMLDPGAVGVLRYDLPLVPLVAMAKTEFSDSHTATNTITLMSPP